MIVNIMPSSMASPKLLRTALFVMVGLCCLPAAGSTTGVRASLSVDLASGTILNAHRASSPSHPASLTKLMTLYLLLEAIEKQRLTKTSALQISARAATQPPTKLGLKAGSTLTVDDALKALMVRSANDVAVAIAEALAGTESAFTKRMNKTGRHLGLTGTYFANASGLPAAKARTTAVDMARITAALYSRFMHYTEYFGLTTARVKGHSLHTHHRLLVSYEGAIGLKTGFTCKAGYNSVTVVKRDGQTVATVILGATSPAQRDRAAAHLLNASFAAGLPEKPTTLKSYRSRIISPLNRQNIAATCNRQHYSSLASPYYRVSGWSIELEAQTTAKAKDQAKRIRKLAPESRILLIPVAARRLIHRAGLTGLKRTRAIKVCRILRAAGQYCVVRPPESMAALKQRAQLAVPR